MKDVVLKLSGKGQVTIPKKVREQLGVQIGDKIRISLKDGAALISKEPSIEDYYGRLDGFWGAEDAAEEIRRWRGRDAS